MIYPVYSVICGILLFISVILALRAGNWLVLWVGLELNMLAFIPMLRKVWGSDHVNTRIKYFVVQAIGSLMLIFSIVINLPIFGD